MEIKNNCQPQIVFTNIISSHPSFKTKGEYAMILMRLSLCANIYNVSCHKMSITEKILLCVTYAWCVWLCLKREKCVCPGGGGGAVCFFGSGSTTQISNIFLLCKNHNLLPKPTHGLHLF